MNSLFFKNNTTDITKSQMKQLFENLKIEAIISSLQTRLKNGSSNLSIIAVIMVIDKSNRFLDDDEDEQSKQVKPS